ncbi:MAG: extracellular solute-binding protein [Firmicutes bacterium]|nr:extracellular solute-binding protein [Bacillota bacterium]
MKKIFALIVVLTMVLSACTHNVDQTDKEADAENPDSKQTTEAVDDKTKEKETANPNEPGWRLDTSPIELDWYVHASWYSGEWGKSVVSKYITEKTGVHVNLVIPSGNENEMLNTLIASNNLPDIISIGFWEQNAKILMDGGMVYALNELADTYDPYFFKVAAEGSSAWYTYPDGNLYCYPNESYSPDQMTEDVILKANQTFVVRKDIYEAIGKPDMRTPEGFLSGLRMAMDYTAENGISILPFCFQGIGDIGSYAFESYIQNLLAIPFEKDGQIYDRFSDPEYLRWMKTFRQAFRDGLITLEPFIDAPAQIEETINNAGYFAMLREWTSLEVANGIINDQNPESIYIAIDGPSNSRLDKPTLYPGGVAGWKLTMISKNCEKPDRAMRFLTYLISEEGQKDFFLGKKGETWDTIDGKDQLLPDVYALLQEDYTKFTNDIGAVDTYWLMRNPVIVNKWRPEYPHYIKQMIEWTQDKVDPTQGLYDSVDPQADTEEGLMLQKMRQLWGRVLPQLIMAESDEVFDQLWADYISQRDALGFEQVQAYRQKKLEENKAKLGF